MNYLKTFQTLSCIRAISIRLDKETCRYICCSLTLHQDHGQPIRSFAAKVNGKANTCAFHKNCTRNVCTQVVDYTDEMVKYVILSGIADEDIKKEVLGVPDLDDKSLNDTITIIENKEMAIRAISQPQQQQQQASTINADTKRTPNSTEIKRIKNAIKSSNNSKFVERDKVLKEFSLCIDCWRKENPRYLMTSRLTAPSSTSSQPSMMHSHRNSPLYLQYHYMVRNNLIITFLMERIVG